MTVQLVVVDGPELAAERAAQLLANAASRGHHVALAGGSTPRRAYELAAGIDPNWSRAHVWFGDERCVPPDDDRSNYKLARSALLARLERQPASVHRVEVERGARAAARAYDDSLHDVELGLALLGVGPDGHTASLFPEAPSLAERERLAVPAAPGLDPRVERVTMTLPTFERAAHVVFLAVGADKAEAVERAFARPPSAETPASLVRGRRTTAILDRAAAARLG